MIFNEIYSYYYNTVGRIIELAQQGKLDLNILEKTVCENAFSESFIEMIPCLTEEKWQIIDKDFKTPIKNKPCMPLTKIQKMWLKAVSMDIRAKLFDVDFSFLGDVEPLFTPEDHYIMDRYNDGDNYSDENYINNFRTILKAIKENYRIKVYYRGKHNNIKVHTCIPIKLQYSEKDDKFRVLTSGSRYADFLNMNRIEKCELLYQCSNSGKFHHYLKKRYFVFQLFDGRNALERVMMQFAHYKKETEKIGDRLYRIKVFYSVTDETELVINVLGFGSHIKVVEPERFVNLIKERLIRQKNIGLK